MSKESHGPIDRDAAERLLRGTPGDPADPLAALLSAAAAPALPRELAREQEVVAAFRSARLTEAEHPRRHAVPGRSFGKLFTLKVAAATIAVTGVGGVALATTGTLPTPLKPRPPVAPASASPDADGGGSNSPSVRPRPPADPPKAAPKTQPPRPLTLIELCRTYTEHPRRDGQRRKLLETPEFRPLVEAAGKPRDVPKFCRKLLGGRPEPTPSQEDSDEQESGNDKKRQEPSAGTESTGTGGLDLGLPL